MAHSPATTTTLALGLIRRDGGTQPRDRIDAKVAEDYAEAIADGAELPAVTVFYDGSTYWLADGFHRAVAHDRLGLSDIAADVRQGTQRDAVLYSVGANAAHGHRRSNADKRRAVLTMLSDPEWSGWHDSEIARATAVGRHFVRKLRDEATCTPSTSEAAPVLRKYINRYGKEAVMNVARIGSTQRKATPVLSAGDKALIATSGGEQIVYVLSDGERCKVGWSTCPEPRITELLKHNPRAQLVAVAKGGRSEELKIHRELEAERDVGEWFVVSPDDVLDVMDRCGVSYTTATMNTSAIGKKADDTAEDDMETTEAASAPQTRYRGQQTYVPEGADIIDLCRKGIAIEEAGGTLESAAAEVGLAVNTYRISRQIVFLADRIPLARADAAVVAEAKELMASTLQCARAWEIARPVAIKVWGESQRWDRLTTLADRRVEQFERTFGIVIQSCLTTDEIELPYLSPEQANQSTKEINRARRALAAFSDRIKEMHA